MSHVFYLNKVGLAWHYIVKSVTQNMSSYVCCRYKCIAPLYQAARVSGLIFLILSRWISIHTLSAGLLLMRLVSRIKGVFYCWKSASYGKINFGRKIYRQILVLM